MGKGKFIAMALCHQMSVRREWLGVMGTTSGHGVDDNSVDCMNGRVD